MKLLLDQGLPRSTARLLINVGIDAVHVADVGLSSASDSTLLVRARDEKRVVVTLDADFHALLALSLAVSPSVIRLRIEGLRAGNLRDLLVDVLKECDNALQEGVAITVDSRRIRLRKLPLI